MNNYSFRKRKRNIRANNWFINTYSSIFGNCKVSAHYWTIYRSEATLRLTKVEAAIGQSLGLMCICPALRAPDSGLRPQL